MKLDLLSHDHTGMQPFKSLVCMYVCFFSCGLGIYRELGARLYACKQWGRQGGRGEASLLWVDVQKLCNMCVLSLSWNFFVSHDKYIARPSSKQPR